MIKLRSLILNTINIQCIKRMKNNIFGGLEHSALLCTLPSRSLNGGLLLFAQICYYKHHISQNVIHNLHRDA